MQNNQHTIQYNHLFPSTINSFGSTKSGHPRIYPHDGNFHRNSNIRSSSPATTASSTGLTKIQSERMPWRGVEWSVKSGCCRGEGRSLSGLGELKEAVMHEYIEE
jgi:hypothetical protein